MKGSSVRVRFSADEKPQILYGSAVFSILRTASVYKGKYTVEVCESRRGLYLLFIDRFSSYTSTLRMFMRERERKMKREKFGSQSWVHPHFSRMRDRIGKCVEIPVHYRRIRRSRICPDLLILPLVLGLPIMVMEFSVGRASQKSAALSFDVLEPKGTKWHWYKYGAMAGNYLLMNVLYNNRRLDASLFL